MAYLHNGKKYRSYKHPILEYIFERAMRQAQTLPDEILFTYEDIRQAMEALGIKRDQQASISNFVIDLTRKAATHEARVPDSVWSQGYDLDRADRVARQGIVGRLVRIELKLAEPWIVWPEFSAEDVYTIANRVPENVRRFIGNDEGALLSVMDYCDVLSLVLTGQPQTILRVQHPKKWQPGEVDGLYYGEDADNPILYPVEAKALSTKDDVNLAQVQGAYHTIRRKIPDIAIVPLAVQMIPDGMLIAVFEAAEQEQLIVSRHLKVILDPPIQAWNRRTR